MEEGPAPKAVDRLSAVADDALSKECELDAVAKTHLALVRLCLCTSRSDQRFALVLRTTQSVSEQAEFLATEL